MNTLFFRWATKLHNHIENSCLLGAIRHSLTLMIPFMLIGSCAIIIVSFPSLTYQNMMTQYFGHTWSALFIQIRMATFGLLSLLTMITVSNLYITAISTKTKTHANPNIASLLTVVNYMILMGTPLDLELLGTTGLFFSILTATITSLLYVKTVSIKSLNLSIYSSGVNPYFGIALKSILPSAITMLPFIILGALIQHQGSTIFIEVNTFLLKIFSNLGDTLFAALLFSLTIHVLWFFGIHGNNILDYVSQNLYLNATLDNQTLIGVGDYTGTILTKPFFDSFVLMGGAGATISLLIAIFIWGKQDNIRRHGKMSLIPSIFNINELVLFGLPIVLEPLYLIPFILVPLIHTTIAFLAISLGLVPYTQIIVEWTTPIFLSGYLTTGSIGGSLLQLFNLIVGVLIYKPFVQLSETLALKRDLNSYNRLLNTFKEDELLNYFPSLSKYNNGIGNIATILIAELELAIKKNEFNMFYQPQFNVLNNVFGVESLLRWEHPRYGFIYPPLILALAEEGGFAEILSQLIITNVIRDTSELNKLGYNDLKVSINLSANELKSEKLVDKLLDIIHTFDVLEDQISIEITEQLAISNNPKIHKTLSRLIENKFSISMDDFGMGHSSLMYLKTIPFDTIKLDGSLVLDIVSNPVSQEIIASIHYLSQSLGFKLLAEYVETTTQRDKLIEFGCTNFQGYLYSKALPFNTLIEFLNNHPKG